LPFGARARRFFDHRCETLYPAPPWEDLLEIWAGGEEP
jgi:hypothetical protein